MSATRRLCLSAAILGLAPITQGCTTGPSGPVTIWGTVTDSLTGAVLRGRIVTFGADSATTDSLGTFALRVAPRTDTLGIGNRRGYLAFRKVMSVTQDRAITIRVRRSLPYLQALTVSAGGLLTATILDLKGAQNVLTNSTATWVIYQDTVVRQSSAVFSTTWSWQQLDPLTWRASVHVPSTSITATIWNLADPALEAALFTCPVATGACSDDIQ